MSFERDEKIDVANARKIEIGGRQFLLPPLTLRQVIALTGLLPQIEASASPQVSLEKMTEVVLLGLKRTYPSLTVDDILDLETNGTELQAASFVVIEQGGAKKDAASGEGVAASQLNPSTGEGSSPTL